jgi:hypothetical protein
MAATTVRIDAFVRHPDGSITVMVTHSSVGSGNEIYFESMVNIDALTEFLAAFDLGEALGYAFAYWRARDPELTNPSLMVGKELIIDFAHPNPIRVTG